MSDVLDLLEERVAAIRSITEDDEPEMHDVEEFKHKIDDHMIGEFVDVILLKIGELEEQGLLELDKQKDIKAAVIAVIRKLNSHSGIISKMSSKFKRYGSKRVLRKAKSEIQKALS